MKHVGNEGADRKVTLLLCAVALFGNVAIVASSLGFVYYFREVFLLDAGGVGLASQIPTLSFFLGCMLLAPAVRALRPDRAVCLSLAGQAATLVGFGFCRSPFVAYGLLAAYGLFQSLLWPAVEVWIVHGKEGRSLARATNAYNFSWSFGMGLATLASGMLASHALRAPFAFSVSLFAVLFLLVASASRRYAVPSEREEAGRDGEGTDRSSPLRYPSWVGLVLVYVVHNTFLTIFPLYASERLGIGKTGTGALLLVRGMAACATFMVIAHTSFWQFRLGFLLGMQASVAVLCLVAARLGSAWAFAPFFLVFGVVYAFCYECSLFHGTTGTIHRARRMAVHEALLTAGQIAGAAVGGAVYQRFSFPFLMQGYALLVAIAVAGELLVAAVLRRARRDRW